MFSKPTKLHRTIRKRTEKAIYDFGMINPGDRVLIGLSGGADSMALMQIFMGGFVQVTSDFEWVAVHVDTGMPVEQETRQDWESFVESLGIDFRLIRTKIWDSAFAPDATKRPCFICSMYRRQRIYEAADNYHCNKIAYAHHKDDIVETLLLNILYGRKIEAMHPVQEVFRGTMHIIRPFCYIEEPLIKKLTGESGLPVLPKACPMDGQSHRQKVKDIIAILQTGEKNANIRENIFKSMSHIHLTSPYIPKPENRD